MRFHLYPALSVRRVARARTGRIGALAAVVALSVGLSGCGTPSGETSGTPATATKTKTATDVIEPLTTAPDPQLPVTVESADGTKVTVASADRIVPLTGSLSEIVFTLGLGERVVARDITATFEQAEELPVVTRAHDVSAEGVLSLEPTVVLADTTTGPAEAIGQIRDAGVPLVVVEPAGELADVSRRIGAVAAALGVPASGDELTARTEARIDAVRETVPAHRNGPALRVAFLYLRGSASVYLLGGAESGASSLLEAAGAVDAGKASGLTKDFTAITAEALAKAAPDAILVMSKGLDSVGGVDGLVKIPGIAETPAGMDRRVVSVDDGVLLNYGPRTDRVLAELIGRLYPEGGGQR
ncbi:ABC transporter substrate-binding protein [Streptomyces nitrosporeus]|uniref:ABC transporter substrate-binding protein n=1 Tax=Streptomyces nitrosporeus TaxID=28894 RepID=A0A5J6FF87_9ACTN|nr:ABC transporter substrate-binding protein [Streptomyces nitrosporeus]GGY85565.1 ABC transporter substrate-binding protein [Streptomyces nitrosporeus]